MGRRVYVKAHYRGGRRRKKKSGVGGIGAVVGVVAVVGAFLWLANNPQVLVIGLLLVMVTAGMWLAVKVRRGRVRPPTIPPAYHVPKPPHRPPPEFTQPPPPAPRPPRDPDPLGYYQTLQLDPKADPEMVEAAWRRLATIYHPDTTVRPDPVRMAAINRAHDVLKDPMQRAQYDRS